MSRPVLPVLRSPRLTGLIAHPAGLLLASALSFAAMAAVAGCQSRDLPSAPAGNPLADVEPSAARLAGRVVEVLPAGDYTYFRLAEGGWAVAMGRGPAVGERIDARVFAEKRDFRSRRLERTFDVVRFVSLTGA